MELYPHNKRAYNNAMHILKKENKTCIIHPTGTGKAVIIATFIDEHPVEKHLLLAPARHIFTEIRKHTINKHFDNSTYKSLTNTKRLKQLTGYHFIYLDEFHRIGADRWGPVVMEIIRLNPAAKVVGTTATHIRFLDEHRDMAFEIFKKNIASHITLNKAFIEGILRAPKYISAMYSIEEEYKNLARRIKISLHEDKKILTTELRRKVIDWQKTSGIDAILKKHVPNSRKRIIIFCTSFQEMKVTDAMFMPIFKEIFSDVLSLHIHSKFKDSINKKVLEEFSSVDERTKVLFTVDMMNEGLHGKDISVGILLRETTSPIIFYQQIGRCFSIGQEEQPIILDLVNNFKNVQIQMFKSDYIFELSNGINSGDNNFPDGVQDLSYKKATIEFIDETLGIRDIFKTFDSQIENWKVYFPQAQDFYKQFGHLYVPKKNLNLYRWIYRIRREYKENVLELNKIKLLTDIGMDWTKSHDQAWIDKFNKLKEFVKVTGIEPSWNSNLGEWLKHQRQKYLSGVLDKEKEKLLVPLVSLDSVKTNSWNNKLTLLKEHHLKHGEFKMRPTDPIYKEIRSVKSAYRIGSLPEFVFTSLKEIGFPFDLKFPNRKTGSWTETIEEIHRFVDLNGRLPLKSDKHFLGNWIYRQRDRFRKHKLKQDQINVLHRLGVLEINNTASTLVEA